MEDGKYFFDRDDRNYVEKNGKNIWIRCEQMPVFMCIYIIAYVWQSMKKNVIINLVNKYYLDLCDKKETQLVINFLRNPELDKLLAKIMKRQWDNIEDDDSQKNQHLNKTE